ncbi:MAG: caspase family protein [Bacteroidia bacterium]|nr:caspase family protein [Bacteroidia bacterium]
MKKIYWVSIALLVSNIGFSQKLLKSIANAHEGQILTVAVNNDGKNVITGGADKRTYIWDTKTGEKIKSFGSHSDKVTGVAYNSNYKTFITASADMKIIVWGADDGKPKSIIKGNTGAITSVAINPVNENIANAAGNEIKLWDEKYRLLASLQGHAKTVNSIAYSPDGKSIVSGSNDNTVRIWDASSGQLLNTINADQKDITSVCFSADGKYVASGGTNGTVKLWSAQSGNKISEFADYKTAVRTVSFSPDAKYIAAGGEGNNVIIWDVDNMQLKENFPANDKGVTAIAFSDNGSTMVSVGGDANLKIWDVAKLNIGKKKFVKETAQPDLVCTPAILIDDNDNAIIETDEKASITFNLQNNGEGLAFDVVANVVLENPIKGLTFDKQYKIGNIASLKSLKISIPVKASQELETAKGKFKITFTEANGYKISPFDLSFQTKGATSTFIMITSFDYTSPTGKAEKGKPITLNLIYQNTTNAEAQNIKVNYVLPEDVIAVDKLSENLGSFKANEAKQGSVQFIANENYGEPKIKVKVKIDGAAFTNADDIDLSITMNDKLPVNIGSQQLLADDQQQLMRGDPLKGLNISTAKKEMEIGNYYALIVGIDKYGQPWPALKNAVKDAKAVEETLKAKYRFDKFIALYDDQATRQSIIDKFEWLVTNVKEKDNVFIYYSGHGEYKENLNKGYWVPVDSKSSSVSNYISNSDIQTFLAGIKSKHTLLISDACFSGDIFRGKTEYLPYENSEKYYQKVHNLSSRQAISSGGIEPVMDGGSDGHSVFCYYLLKILKSNTNKYFDAGQLYSEIKIPIVNNSNQTPNFSPIKNTGDEGGQFIFIKK